MSTDLARLDPGGLTLDREGVARALDDAVRRNDAEAIFVASVGLDSQRRYDAARGLRERAAELAALVVHCNAAIGEVDMATTGQQRRDPLVIAGKEIGNGLRIAWRALAAARMRGVLDERIDEAGDEPTSSSVALMCRRAGDCYVPRAAVDAAVEAYGRANGLSRTAVLRRIGHPDSSRGTVCTWATAVSVSRLLGTDPGTWPQSDPNYRRRGTKGRRKRYFVTHAKSPTGGRWDETYSRFRKLIQEFDRVAPSNDPRNDAAYEHLYALERIIGRAMKGRRQSEGYKRP